MWRNSFCETPFPCKLQNDSNHTWWVSMPSLSLSFGDSKCHGASPSVLSTGKPILQSSIFPKHIARTAVFPKPDYAAVLAFALYSAVNALKVLTERLSALQRNAERKRWHAHCVEKEFQGAEILVGLILSYLSCRLSSYCQVLRVKIAQRIILFIPYQAKCFVSLDSSQITIA